MTVFYSVLGTPTERKRADRALQRCAPYIHHLLIKRLKLKLVPKIAFRYDDTPRRASRIDKLIDDIEKEQGV
jgi:ribosome-binding factor A